MSENQEKSLHVRTYGGCEGPDSEYIKLISSDNFEFIVKREYAYMSKVIEAMLTGPLLRADTEINEAHLKNIPSYVIADVCRYFAYKAKYTDSTKEIPQFPIKPEAALYLLVASCFLHC